MSTSVTVRLDAQQQKYLVRLSKESCRPVSQVLQHLIVIAANNPEIQRGLGIWDWKNNKPKQIF